MFARPARLPVNVILGVSDEGTTADTEELAPKTKNNLRLTFQLARRNLPERAAKQTANNKTLPPYPAFHPHQQVLLNRLYRDSDGPNSKTDVAAERTNVICSQLAPVVYRLTRMDGTREMFVHLAHLKPYHPRKTSPAPQFDSLAVIFFGKQVLIAALNHPDEDHLRIEPYVVDRVVGH